MPDQPKKPSGISRERSKDIVRRIVERLPNKRMPPCPICTQTSWELAQGFVSLALTENPGQFVLGGQTLPCAVIVCRICGNTVLLNTVVLNIPIVATPEPAELKVEAFPPEVKQGPSESAEEKKDV